MVGTKPSHGLMASAVRIIFVFTIISVFGLVSPRSVHADGDKSASRLHTSFATDASAAVRDIVKRRGSGHPFPPNFVFSYAK
jgi:hypothetical protein